jgi:hypothetical protein
LAIGKYKKIEERYMNNASNSVKIGPLACASAASSVQVLLSRQAR